MLVTGGWYGIGAAVARELAGLGACIGLVGRNEDKLRRMCNELQQNGAEVAYYVCDIRHEETVVTTVEHLIERFGRLDGLVNNAGGQFFSPAAQISANGCDAVVRNNLLGGFPSMVPPGRLGTEAEVSAAITFLLSPAAAFISGAVIQIDGAAPNRRSHWPVDNAGSTEAL